MLAEAVADSLFQVVDHVFDFHAGEAVVEGEGDGAVGDAFGDGEVAAFEAVVFHVEGLEMNGGEVVGAADVVGAEVVEDGVAVGWRRVRR